MFLAVFTGKHPPGVGKTLNRIMRIIRGRFFVTEKKSWRLRMVVRLGNARVVAVIVALRIEKHKPLVAVRT